MKTTFQSPEYLANTGIVVGLYGGVGYYNLNPIEKRKAVKQTCVKNQKVCPTAFLKKLWEGLVIEKAA